MKNKDCKYKNAYPFHENTPLYCPDCKEHLEVDEIFNRLHRGYYLDSYHGDEINMNKGAEKLLNKLINRVDKLEEQTNNALKNIKKDLDTYKDIEEKEKLKEKELPWWCVEGVLVMNKLFKWTSNIVGQQNGVIILTDGRECSIDKLNDLKPIGGVFDFISTKDISIKFFGNYSCAVYRKDGSEYHFPIWFRCPQEFVGNKYDLKDFLK